MPGLVGYVAGSDGSIWSRWKPTYPTGQGRIGAVWVLSDTRRRLRDADNGDGRRVVHIRIKGRRGAMHKVHRLVLLAFVGPCPPGLVGCHNDGNPANNTPGNLRWDTRSGNMADTVAHGTRLFGARNPAATLTASKVKVIRADYVAALGHRKKVPNGAMRQIAERHGVNPCTINKIMRGDRWAHLAS